ASRTTRRTASSPGRLPVETSDSTAPGSEGSSPSTCPLPPSDIRAAPHLRRGARLEFLDRQARYDICHDEAAGVAVHVQYRQVRVDPGHHPGCGQRKAAVLDQLGTG